MVTSHKLDNSSDQNARTRMWSDSCWDGGRAAALSCLFVLRSFIWWLRRSPRPQSIESLTESITGKGPFPVMGIDHRKH
eukprot:COSAG05_NODE_62_length_23051_cov_19.660291_4_plen_79_part_00